VVGSLRRIGAVRLRQLRVKQGADCDIPPKFGNIISDCAGGFSRSNEAETPFGPPSDPDRYTWSSRSDLNGVFTWGFVETYSGSGYVVNLPDSADGAAQVVSTLKADKWVDKYTRAVFLEFTLYNPSVNLFVVSSMLVEFPASGGAFPNPTFRTVRLFRYQLVSDYIRLVFELIFVLFVIYYIVEEGIEMRDQGWAYFKTGWSLLDILNLCLFLAVIAIRIAQVYKEGRLPIEDLQQSGGQDTFISFQDVAWIAQQEVNVNSCNAFLSWFKIFKFVKMSKRLSQLSRTLARASVDIVNFLLMFMVVFLGYAHMGYMLFGVDIHAFRLVLYIFSGNFLFLSKVGWRCYQC
jgi:polycystin 2